MADRTKYVVRINGVKSGPLAKRQAILRVVKDLIQGGVHPDELWKLLERKPGKLNMKLKGRLNASQVEHHAEIASRQPDGTPFMPRQWFLEEENLFHVDGYTHVFTNQWGGEDWESAMRNLGAQFPGYGIKYEPETADVVSPDRDEPDRNL